MKFWLEQSFRIFIIWALVGSTAAAQAQEASSVSFFADHSFKVIEGRCADVAVSGSATKSGSTFTAQNLTIQCSIPRMTTGNRNRDSNMWEMLGYPQVQQITVLVPSASAKAGKAPVSFVVRMHGKEKSMTSDMNFEEQSGSVVVSGDFTVSLAEYDVTPPKLLMLKVGDAVLIRFRIAVPVQGK